MKRGGSVTGVVSLIMIFCVLCLSVFAVLTVATSQREHRMAQLFAERAEAYYAADKKAVETVAELRRGGTPMGVVYTGAQEASFSVPVAGDQSLEVTVRLPEEDGGEVRILSWKTVYNGVWEPENGINLFEDWGF